MGFTWDSAITVNADLEIGEQQMTNLLRGTTTYDALHKDAANAIFRDLTALGYDPAKIDEKYFKREARLFVFVQIFAAQVRDGNQKAQGKHQAYLDEYLREKKANREGLPRFATVSSDTLKRGYGGRVLNLDGGYFHGPALPNGTGAHVGENTIKSFDDYVKNNPT